MKIYINYFFHTAGYIERNDKGVYTVRMHPEYRKWIEGKSLKTIPDGEWDKCPKFILDRIPHKGEASEKIYKELWDYPEGAEHDPMLWLKYFPAYSNLDCLSFSIEELDPWWFDNMRKRRLELEAEGKEMEYYPC